MTYLDQKTTTSIQSNVRRRTKTWRILRAKLQQLTLLEINTTKEGQTQTWTQAPTQVQMQTQKQLITASIPPTFYTAVLLPWHWILPWPRTLLVAKQQNSSRRRLLNYSIKTNASTAKRLRTINCNAQRSSNQWLSLQIRYWHWSMLVRWLCLNQAIWRRKTSNPHNNCCGR